VKTIAYLSEQDIALACKEYLQRNGWEVDAVVVDVEDGPENSKIPVVKAQMKAGWAPKLRGAEEKK
jgi:hypothetical protein